MIADFGDRALVKNTNLVGVLDRRQSVRDEDTRSAGLGLIESGLHNLRKANIASDQSMNDKTRFHTSSKHLSNYLRSHEE